MGPSSTAAAPGLTSGVEADDPDEKGIFITVPDLKVTEPSDEATSEECEGQSEIVVKVEVQKARPSQMA